MQDRARLDLSAECRGDRRDRRARCAHLKTTGRQIPDIAREHFPLERFARTLRLLQTEIENGLGIMLVRGLPRDRYSAEEMGLIYWGIGAHFGRAVAQNAQGDVLGHVRDMGRRPVQGHARTRLPDRLAPAVPQRLLRHRRPVLPGDRAARRAQRRRELGRRLQRARRAPARPGQGAERAVLHADRRGEESPGQKPYYITPIFIWHNGRMFNRYNRTFINSAQRFNEVPRLTDLQVEALDSVDRLCNDRTASGST